MTSVLDVMLSSYAFMISGLLVPVAFAFRAKRAAQSAAVLSMLAGGSTTLLLQANTPMALMAVGLDANAYGILVSLVVFLAIDRRTISPHTSP
jgi:SSS family solute:Na+ symporter